MELPDIEYDRARLGWWLFVAVLFAAAMFIVHSFVGMISLGVFGYYATRPIYRKIDTYIDTDRLAAGLTVTFVIGPIILLALYTGFRAFQRVQTFLGDGGGSLLRQFVNLDALTPGQRDSLQAAIQNPQSLLSAPQQTVQEVFSVGLNAISAAFGGLLLIGLALTLSYFLLERQEQLSGALLSLIGGHDSPGHAFAVAVDEDLESVFFGNLLFVVVMSVLAAVAYYATNYFAPQGLHIPMVFTLAFLTGVASLIPIVVGKIIYLPVVGYLAFQTIQSDGGSLTFVAGALVAYFLVLDILPQALIQPYITGRELDMVLMMFAYVLGPVLFGWYGFFFLPIVFVVMLEAVRIIVPELLRGDPITTHVSLGQRVGTDPESEEQVTHDDPVNQDDDHEQGGDDGEGSSEAAASE
ncbi:AI-2E family transporter [Candidatus Halobonum tyrrellensis]|uniref:Permease n=1 Tax=Candidatus Halobonum tyrrellensis G22 TaxID=1324957 RepID=V4HIR1_9EURY|nr:AI-2E family transporter [Candidatus Halobonum tyrrellensis]ESP89683.1 permease [Candidatus Halobonum tyrrellensis G22]